MATPPEPPKAPKSAKPATPAPRRSARTASTSKAASPKRAAPKTTAPKPAAAAAVAPAASAAETKAPAAARPVPKRTSTRKAVTPATASPAKAKPGPKVKATPAAKSTSKTGNKSVATTVSGARQSLAAALPAVKPKTAWSLGAVALAAGAGIAAFLTRGRIMALLMGKANEGHVPTDLLDPQRNADDRAVADFRPDMDAVMTAAEREALRPPPGLPN